MCDCQAIFSKNIKKICALQKKISRGAKNERIGGEIGGIREVRVNGKREREASAREGREGKWLHGNTEWKRFFARLMGWIKRVPFGCWVKIHKKIIKLSPELFTIHKICAIIEVREGFSQSKEKRYPL